VRRVKRVVVCFGASKRLLCGASPTYLGHAATSALCSIPDSFTAKKIEEFGAALSKGAKGKERLSRGGFPDINYFH
jgi:hypothetical protein